ncbi:type VI secretion system baseplate subunit TssF [Massilia horti]|uniref:Type VI secretion system baseplate subunit TssF n=1 Tax=Massilia horti TaxID=2562153 RepID=A0A4Y9T313_9BURK|nr:type VI secretion system baseplate subunit TssF [Massilia horti]TFW33581.1 type VI secretion system baseplate subunit TssF [Massilia horti]
MSSSLQNLLRYFQHELVMNDALRDDFTRRHPSLASSLGMAGAGAEQDPHIQQLLQAIALMNAHTAMRIDAGHDWLTEALLHMNYPHYLRPFPSCTIVQFDAGDTERGAHTLETVTSVQRGTLLLGPVSEKVRCQFRTVYPVTIAPIRLCAALFGSALSRPAAGRLPPEVTHLISLTFETTSSMAGIGDYGLEQLRLFIDAEPSLCAHLRDAVYLGVTSAWLECGEAGSWVRLRQLPLRSVGFTDDEAILPFQARSHHAFRLLTEYGCFPEKFNFLGLDLAACANSIPAGCHRVTLHLGVAGMRHDSDAAQILGKLTQQHLRLFCTPAVNLFNKAGCAIELDHTKTEYVLPTDAVEPRAFDLYSIDRVSAIEERADGRGEAQEFFPYYSLKHGIAGGRRGNYYYFRRKDLLADLSPGYEHAISLVDLDLNPLQVKAAKVSIDLTCTNRDLPTRMPFGARNGDLSMAEPLGGIPIRILRRPSRSYRFSPKDRWRLISHLSLNHHSLMQGDVAPLAELLTLYNLPQSPVNARQVGGIVALSAKPARIRWREDFATSFIRGIEIRLAVDEQAYAGCGLHAFVQVLDHFFGLYVHLNSYVQLIVVCHQTGKEILRCSPRSGSLQLL